MSKVVYLSLEDQKGFATRGGKNTVIEDVRYRTILYFH
jgi:hypothetical protein